MSSEASVLATRRPTLKALTTLRFFAAFHVVLFHVGRNFMGGAPKWLQNFIMSGFTGVSLFFVLSGFILAYNYFDRQPDGQVDRRDFWSARFARIYPMYALGLLLALPLFIKEVGYHLEAGRSALQPVLTVPATVLLVQAWTPLFQPAWNALGWTLSVEAFFYLVFPFVAPRLSKLTQRHLLELAAGFYLLSLLPVVWFHMVHPGGLPSLTDQAAYVTAWAIQGNPLGRLPEFLMGMCLGKVFLDRRESRLPSRTTTLWTIVALSNIVSVAALLDPDRAKLWYAAMLDPFFLLLIYTLAKADGPVAKLLSLNFGVLLGEASYGLYIVHTTFAIYFFALLRRGPFIRSPESILRLDLVWFFVYCVLVVGSCCLLFLRFETPLRKRIRRRLSPRPSIEHAIP